MGTAWTTAVAWRAWPLQNNGGPTLTHALTGSPAIDTGNPAAPGSGGAACAGTDQRGVTRPQDGNGDGAARCDMGTLEVSPVGAFALEPSDDIVRVGERVAYLLTYTITGGRSWRELATLDLRIRDAHGVVLWIRFDEIPGTLGTFSLVDPGTGRVGPAFSPASANRLETSAATLHLADMLVDPNGPHTSSVTVTLEVSFKPQAAGRHYDIEILATITTDTIRVRSWQAR